MNGLVLYSASTDVTGRAVADALKFKGGKKWLGKPYDVVIAWGYTGNKHEDFDANVLAEKCGLVINNPSAIAANSDKHKAFKMMQDAGVPVPKFATNEDVEQMLDAGDITMPLIGRKRKHQGGKNLHLILERTALDHAIASGCKIFTEYVPKKREYRVHVVNGEVVQVCRKIQQEEPVESWKTSKQELILQKAAKANLELDNDTLDFALNMIVGRDFELPNFTVQSNKLGWKFSFRSKYPKGLEEVCIAACKAVNLDFGAVDCVMAEDDTFKILEVNSGPGLCDAMLEQYVERFNNMIATFQEQQKAPSVEETKTIEVVEEDVTQDVASVEETSEVIMSGTNEITHKILKALAGMPQDEAAGILGMIEGMSQSQLAGLEKLISIQS